jgi:hypothetical protein
MNYEPATIRRFLQERFNDEELNHLCFDYFPDVNNEFTVGMRKGQKIQMLMEHCQKQARWSALLGALQRERPEAYQSQFEGHLGEFTRHSSMPSKRNQRLVFISHSHQDAEFAQHLAIDLRKREWEVWIAPESIQPGEKWQEAINRGLAECGVFVLILTPSAVTSRWVLDETNVAIELMHEGQLKLLPLLFVDCDVPLLWRVHQQINFQNDYKAGLRSIPFK